LGIWGNWEFGEFGEFGVWGIWGIFNLEFGDLGSSNVGIWAFGNFWNFLEFWEFRFFWNLDFLEFGIWNSEFGLLESLYAWGMYPVTVLRAFSTQRYIQ